MSRLMASAARHRAPALCVWRPEAIGARVEHATGTQTLPEMIRQSVARQDGASLRFPPSERWVDLSYTELVATVREIAGGLIALGLRPGERVSILSGTRPEWMLVDLGALSAGAVVAPIYHSDSPAECEYILAHADSWLVFCADAEQLAKVELVRDRCPQLEHERVRRGRHRSRAPAGRRGPPRQRRLSGAAHAEGPLASAGVEQAQGGAAAPAALSSRTRPSSSCCFPPPR